ncbi:TPA: L-ribulose-5-phosphate 3-epimerase [Enterococcus faecalis]|nr:L-ribulose-5-phosphate 3-epimerase [Enterococcus faecalis]
MKRPNLQIALDHNSLEDALADCMKVGEIVDIIEVGTILCLQEGQKAIRCLKRMFPNKTIVADTKCADAGGTVARNVAQAGADFMTVICCATLPTMAAAQKEVRELQVELYGNWTMQQARQWRELGINQVIYHQSRDALLAGGSWGEKDLNKVQELIDLGFEVSITGGLTVETLELFQTMAVATFIAGRGITESKNPEQAAKDFQKKSIRFGSDKMARIGLYEKALPQNLTWAERLTWAKKLGFDFLEMSIDESDERLARLAWTPSQLQELSQLMVKEDFFIHSLCLSGHRRFPLGSLNKETREKGRKILSQAIRLAHQLNIRVIQIAGYDVFYEEKTAETREFFLQGLKKGVEEAAQYGVILAVEIMDDPFMNSIQKFLEIKEQIPSPFLHVYPDLGNLSAWPENNPAVELEKGIAEIAAIHLKDTFAVTDTFEGKFREVTFGEGCVDFTGLLKTLKRLNYSGPFLIEMWNETDLNFQEKIQAAQQYLYPKLAEVGYYEQ